MKVESTLYLFLMTDEDRKILLDIAQRKLANDDACDPCRGTGLLKPDTVCAECLGEGIPLYVEEYNALRRLSGRTTDDILGAEIIE
jgi:hypothetical protein